MMSIEKLKECVDNEDTLGAAIACQSLEDLNITYKEIHNVTPLMYAAYSDAPSVVELLLGAGAELEMKTHGRTALHYATQRNHLECARVLRARGAKINIVDASGWTSLKHACQNRNLDMINMLLAYPEPTDMKNVSSALRLATLNGSTDIVKLLLEAGACISIKSEHGETALDIAKKMDHKDVIELLISY